MDKIANRIRNLFYIACGLGGASIALGFGCLYGGLGKWWALAPAIPLLFVVLYMWGSIDAVDVIISEKQENE